MMMVHLFIDDDDSKPFDYSKLSSKKKKKLIYLIVTAFSAIAFVFYWTGENEGRGRLLSDSYAVVVSCDGKIITGYSYLTRNEDTYFFYKTGAGAVNPEILVLRAEKVGAMTYGKALP